MKNIAVVCGGYSGESVISLKSADTVLKTIDSSLYTLYKVVIEKEKWEVWIETKKYSIDKNDFSITLNNEKIIFDCVFNVIHGTPGEDGKLQGYLDLLNIPYTSCDVLTSAVTFNKEVCKRIATKANVKTAKSVLLTKKSAVNTDAIAKHTGIPCFVKPNNGGSSIGASKVTTQEMLQSAIEKAFQVDDEILIEEYLSGTEITCGVAILNEKPTALGITEIVSTKDFFDFDAKYENKSTQEITPARISKEHESECKKTSEMLYSFFECKGMIRVDYMIHNNQLYMVEINTIPGLTERSLIPQQAAYYGVSMQDLFHASIDYALTEKN